MADSRLPPFDPSADCGMIRAEDARFRAAVDAATSPRDKRVAAFAASYKFDVLKLAMAFAAALPRCATQVRVRPDPGGPYFLELVVEYSFGGDAPSLYLLRTVPGETLEAVYASAVSVAVSHADLMADDLLAAINDGRDTPLTREWFLQTEDD